MSEKVASKSELWDGHRISYSQESKCRSEFNHYSDQLTLNYSIIASQILN